MSRKLTLTATALALALAGPAVARPPEPPAAASARAPATAEERAAYERTDALTRSAFWADQARLNPHDPIAGARTAQALRELGRHDQAAEAAAQVLIVQPDNVEALLELGRAHIARGQAFYGVAPLEQARAAAPGDWRPLSLLGVAYQQVRRPEDARQAWNDGLRLSPDNPAILANAAMALAADGDAAGAEALLRRAARQPGAGLQVRQNLALVLGLQGKAGEAEQILRRDLPPEQAEANLAWLRARMAAGGGEARTWQSLAGG